MVVSSTYDRSRHQTIAGLNCSHRISRAQCSVSCQKRAIWHRIAGCDLS